METPHRDHVTVKATIVNLQDVWEVRTGRRMPDQVRSVVVPDALAGRTSSPLGLPADLMRRLGLTRTGYADVVRLEIQGRDWHGQVRQLPEGSRVRIGHTVLENMDWVIDMTGHKLIGNPAHNGEWVTDMPSVWFV